MENPADYDIDKDMGDEDVDENKIGNMLNFVPKLCKTQILCANVLLYCYLHYNL